MALSARLELRTSQALVMTPQLMQAIKLLQLSHLDLAAYVEAELERNPLLERDDDAAPADPESDRDSNLQNSGEDRQAPAAAASAETGSDESASDADERTAADQIAAAPDSATTDLDADPGDVYPEDGPSDLDPALLAGSASRSSGDGARSGALEDFDLDNVLASEKTLADHLADQLTLSPATPTQRIIGSYLIDNVDDTGYLRLDLAQTAHRLGTTLDEVEATLAILQTFEPTGVCARDLAECLALQLRERNRLDPAMQALLHNIVLLARHDFAALKRICGVDEEDLADMIGEIKALDPKPGNAFGGAPVQTVIPDILVRTGAHGGWAIELNADALPRVLVNRSYYATVAAHAHSETDKSFLTDCLQSANWLVKSLDQRARTILKVATEIVRQQDMFLAHGVHHLRPLNLRTVADSIGMHESTVSRVTSNKYMATPRGIFELKYFFTSAIASSEGGEAHSAEAVRHRIRQLVENEPPTAILSDDAIVKALRESGIDIARRTVAKYREALHIPSSVQRRREKQAVYSER